MRIITMVTGVLLAALGVFCIATAGLTFISLAFPIGIILIIVGLVECLAYKRTIEDEESRHWLLIEGLTSFILGVVVLTGQLAADIAVPVVFGMWSLVSGIRGLVIVARNLNDNIEKGHKHEKDADFYWTAAISLINVLIGIYTFFNTMLFQWTVLLMLGVCFVAQGANVVKIGLDIKYKKPDLIKTKEEKVEAAAKEAVKSRAEAKKAIKKAKNAMKAVKDAEEAKEFHEIISEPINEELPKESNDK